MENDDRGKILTISGSIPRGELWRFEKSMDKSVARALGLNKFHAERSSNDISLMED